MTDEQSLKLSGPVPPPDSPKPSTEAHHRLGPSERRVVVLRTPRAAGFARIAFAALFAVTVGLIQAPEISTLSNVGAARPVIRGEKRWPMAITLVVAMALPLLLPQRFSYVPRWVVPLIEALLLVTLILADPGRIDRRSRVVRAISLGLVTVLVAGAAGVTVRLIADLVRGGPETNSPGQLLRVGLLVWLYSIISFAFLYWELDTGGPEARAVAPSEYPDLAFPEHLNPHLTQPGWRPEFFDYLYLGFTNATAFSPTDVMPLARWAKLAMSIQASGSLIILGLVIARAVNILK